MQSLPAPRPGNMAEDHDSESLLMVHYGSSKLQSREKEEYIRMHTTLTVTH